MKLIIWFIFFTSCIFPQSKSWHGKSESKEGVVFITNQIGESKQIKNLEVKNILTIGSEDSEPEYYFSIVTDIKTDTDGNIYVCDQREHKINVYDKNGKFRYSFGKEGKCPGDLLRPNGIALGKNKIFIHDDLNLRISVFNKGGKFDKAILLNKITFNLCIDKQENLYVTNNVDKLDDYAVTAYNYKGNAIQNFCSPQLIAEKDQYGNKRFASNDISAKSNLVFVNYLYPYMIHVYEQGVLKKVINNSCRIVTKPELIETELTLHNNSKTKIKNISSRISRSDLFMLEDNGIVIVLFDKGNDYRNNTSEQNVETILHVFDKDGYFVNEYRWDWKKKGIIKHIDEDGKIYSNTCQEENPGIRVWETEIFKTANDVLK